MQKKAAKADEHHVMKWDCVELAAQVHTPAKQWHDYFSSKHFALLFLTWRVGGGGGGKIN